MQSFATAIIEQLGDMGYRATLTSAPTHYRGAVWTATATKGRHVHRSTDPSLDR